MGYTTAEMIELMEKAAQLRVSVEVSDNGFALKIDGREHTTAAPATQVAAPQPQAPAQLPESAPAQPVGKVIKSPIVGTYYSAPAPDKAAFVEVGKPVKKGDVLFVIESMKLMNEITSECDGIVKELLVGNGQAVEFGQPILVL